ncbi:VCBS repeat-containing protein [Daejeonella oryzae]|uniref:VCBS repeat-containing protein n=1 Tax=Daejeonella oryzae TaxID=1122943 RepID=UPI0004226EDD|nr:VCBS repeat-containing protein [Daejeonella oryzae]
MYRNFYFLSLILLILSGSCTRTNKDQLFTLQDNKSIGIEFSNQLSDRTGTNIFSFRNYYNGGGVAIGDVNNDGLNDIFLTSNQEGNQLLLNKGNWQFDNVSAKAGVKGSKYWSTGVTMVDINADGWLDIYVCNSGNAQGNETENELFINQQDGKFKEEGKKYGLADRGLSTHAVFFDYDLDGDLDCYVLNNSFRPIGSFDFSKDIRNVVDELGGDRLYQNNNGYYKEVNKLANIYSSDIGFGLGVSVVDINQDGYPDIYVSNDFFERDYLYINQKNGTFKENIQSMTGHLSLASMGSDIADINNDGLFDIFTTEMLPEGDQRLKSMTSFESYDVGRLKQRDGFYNQYMQNCLQLNNGDSTFSEIGFYSGVAATDWSWGALFFDMNNDGWKDIFVSNGIYKDLTNQDYIEFLANKENMEKIAAGKKFDHKDFTDKMTSTPIPNYAFINNKNLTFGSKSSELGLDQPSFSNGAAYGDLDNDGDDDLVINNVNMPLFVYKNNAEKLNNHSIQFKLQGDRLNTYAVGSTVKVFTAGNSLIYYHQPARGFQSSISPNLITVGLGKEKTIDSVQIIWPDGKYKTIKNLKADSVYKYSYEIDNQQYAFKSNNRKPFLSQNTSELFDSIPRHIENDFIDFDNERLMLQMLSTENPYMAKGDLNADGLEDFYFSNSQDSEAAIYVQQSGGRFLKYIPDDFKKHIYLENAGAVFGDFDKDGDEDLMCTYGGNQEEADSKVLYPRFYENDGRGKLKWNSEKSIKFSINASVIIKSDFDDDGDDDLLIGGRSTPGVYGSAPKSYVLENDGSGNFKDVSSLVFGKNQNNLGMVTDAKWADLDGNGSEDLVIAGNWMGIRIFMNTKGKFSPDNSLLKFKGWWSSLQISDINKDGKLDILAGNLGTNSKFKATEKEPLRIFVKDFDNNGTKECITSIYKSDHKSYVFHLKPDLVGQLPSLKKRFLRYEDYAGKTFDEVFTPELLKGAESHEINFLQSAVFFNKGKGNYAVSPFPARAQFTSVNSILVDDLNRDGNTEIILTGNFYGFKPEVGRLDAGYGDVFTFKNNKFIFVQSAESGLKINGQVRSSIVIKNKSGEKYYLFGRNNDSLLSYRLN